MTAGNAKVSVTVPYIATCLTPSASLSVAYKDASVAGSKKTKLTFVHATLTLDGKLRATAKRKSESFKLRLAGLKAGTYTLKVITTYHYKVGAKTKTFTKTQEIKVKVC